MTNANHSAGVIPGTEQGYFNQDPAIPQPGFTKREVIAKDVLCALIINGKRPIAARFDEYAAAAAERAIAITDVFIAALNADAIELTAKMYQCQKAAKGLFREEYASRIQWYIEVIRKIKEQENCNEIQAVLFISKMPHIQGDGFTIMLFTAAIVEIMEPAPAHSAHHKPRNQII